MPLYTLAVTGIGQETLVVICTCQRFASGNPNVELIVCFSPVVLQYEGFAADFQFQPPFRVDRMIIESPLWSNSGV